MGHTRVWPDEQRGLLALFPLVYVAWSDLELEPTEIDGIREVSSDAAPELQAALGSWLDPSSPPTASELSEMARWIREGGTEPAVDAGAAAAVERLEEALGVASDRVRRAVLHPPYVHAWPAPEVPSPTFDVDRLADLLDGPYGEERAAMRARIEGWAHADGLSVDAQRDRIRSLLLELGEAGFGALAYPGITTEYPTMGPFLAAFETLATFDLALWVKAGVQFGLFGGSLFFLGTERHHALLPEVARGRLLGCFAMTETGHGSNVRALGTTATWDGARQGFVLHTPTPGDRKDYVGNAAQDGRFASVFAQLLVGDIDYGVHAFLVRIRADDGSPVEGVTTIDNGKKMGLDGVDNGRIAFDHVFVPRADMLDRFGRVNDDGTYESAIASPSRRFFTMLGTLVGGRISVANAAVSASKVALAIAVRYSHRRRQFGPEGGPELTIADYASHQRRLMPPLAATVALDLAMERLTTRYEGQALDDDGDRRELEADVAGLKAICTWHATAVIQTCREACGGAGYLAVNRFAALKADSDVFTTFEGDNTVLLQLVAKALLTGFRAQFTEQRMLGVARFVASQAERALHRANPFEHRATGRGHLRDAGLQRDLLEYRTRDQVQQVARALRAEMAEVSPQEAFNRVQNRALAMATSHVEQRVLTALAEVEEAEEDDAVRGVLARIRSLYALHRIEADLGWFLEHGYMARAQATAIREEVEALCGEVADDAWHVVAAFRLPSTAVAAPIAQETPGA